MLGYDGVPEKLGPVLRHEHTYLLQRHDGFVIAGSTEERIGFDREIDPAQVKDLHERAGRLWAPLARRQPSRVWFGLRPATESGQIYCERWKDTNVWLAYGHFRNGILLAPWTGDFIAAGILSANLGTGSSATAGTR
jgi:glycine oxidase